MRFDERRHVPHRTAVLNAIVTHIVHAPDAIVTIESLQALVQVPADAARRIVERLVASGILIPAGRDAWVSQPLAPRPTEPASGFR